jgi:large subunit ribosomal protein L21
MYAILKTGGKQYTVREKDIIRIEKLEVEEGQEIKLSDVLFIGGGEEMIGSPNVEGAQITGKVLSQGRGKKINGFTFKPKKNEHRRYGHRQAYTEVLIEKIAVKKPKARKKAEEAAEADGGES